MASNNDKDKELEEKLRRKLKEEADRVKAEKRLADLRARIVREQIAKGKKRRLRDKLRRKKKK